MTMASCSLHCVFLLSLSLFSVCCFSALSNEPLSEPIFHTIFKDPKTNLFYTYISIGQNPINNIELAIDLSGPSLWYLADSDYVSYSYRPIPCGSSQCPPSSFCSDCNAKFKPGCSNNTCGLYLTNPLASSIFTGELSNDVVFFLRSKVTGLLSGCSRYSDDIVVGLPEWSKGIMGLARTKLSLPSQLSLLNNLPPKFSICFPSSTSEKLYGRMYFGAGAPSYLSHSLFTTSLIINPVSTAPIYEEGDSSYEYFIQVLSINVDGKVVNFDPSLLSFDKKGNGGTKISTMQNFTSLHSNIFKPLVRDFVKRASDKKMKKVKPVAPFEACYDEQSIGKTSTGMVDVPIVELIVEGGVGWSIHGSNSMVNVKKNVVCLGFVDGGKTPKGASGSTAIVIGGRQLEDNLLEFDLASSKLSFSSSLLVRNVSCSTRAKGSVSSV